MRKIIFFCFVVFSLLVATPSLWSFYLWTHFPESSLDRVREFQSELGIGKECKGAAIGIEAEQNSILACFANAVEDRFVLDDKRIGNESISRIYRCESAGFSGEIVYIFYSTHERYHCSYKIAQTWEDIPKYQVGDVAGFNIEASWLTTQLANIYRKTSP